MRSFPGIMPADIYLPAKHVDPAKWAVVACDQYTSQKDYWEKAEAIVSDAPSTLRIIQPEIYLAEAEKTIPLIRSAMKEYLEKGVIEPRVRDGFILTERRTESGARLGLIAAVDLDQYDYAPGVQPLIRATEGTITERIPPRVKIRDGALIESPHIMMLIDDPECLTVEAIYAAVREDEPLYDFELMLGGGHLRGWSVTKDEHLNMLSDALGVLNARADGFLYAVGDGNHSLATAKACWEKCKQTLDQSEWETHPAKYALCEIVNLHSPALVFEPIHRVLFSADADSVLHNFTAYLQKKGLTAVEGRDIVFVSGEKETGISVSGEQALPVAILQPFLDEYLKEHSEIHIDYVHGEEAVRSLAVNKNTGILLGAIDKGLLFPSIRSGGVLPRKTFSMGEAHEKRYYMEVRKIV